MDNSSEAWSTSIAAVVALGVGAAALAAAAAVTESDPAGRVLITLAALAAAALAVLAAVQRPKLAVDDRTLKVRTLRGTRGYERGDVIALRLVPYPRLGRRVPMLELDVREGESERLVIFGRWDLGADPRAVFDVLERRGWIDDEWSQRT